MVCSGKQEHGQQGKLKEVEKDNGKRLEQKNDAKLSCTGPHRLCRGKVLNMSMDLEGSYWLTNAKEQKGNILRRNGSNVWKRMRTEICSVGQVRTNPN